MTKPPIGRKLGLPWARCDEPSVQCDMKDTEDVSHSHGPIDRS